MKEAFISARLRRILAICQLSEVNYYIPSIYYLYIHIKVYWVAVLSRLRVEILLYRMKTECNSSSSDKK